MRVACPECAAEYDLPPGWEERLADGRTLRCARCAHVWPPFPAPPPVPAPLPAGAADAREPEAGEPEAAAPPAIPPTPERPPPVAPPLPRRAAGQGWRGTGPAWAASLLLLAALAAAAWHWRVAVVEAWPPAARAYIALGLAG